MRRASAFRTNRKILALAHHAHHAVLLTCPQELVCTSLRSCRVSCVTRLEITLSTELLKHPGLIAAHGALAGHSSAHRPNPWAGHPADDAWHGRPPLARTLGSADSAASMAASLASIDRELLYGPPATEQAAAGRRCASYTLPAPQLTDGQMMVRSPQAPSQLALCVPTVCLRYRQHVIMPPHTHTASLICLDRICQCSFGSCMRSAGWWHVRSRLAAAPSRLSSRSVAVQPVSFLSHGSPGGVAWLASCT